MKLIRGCASIVFALNLGLIFSIRAAVTVSDYWRMGENDPGSTNGGIAASTVDNVGGRTMTLNGGPFWKTAVSSSATAKTGSTLGMNFITNSVWGTNSAITGLTNNFGLELWVNPNDTSGTKCLAYDGDPTNSGWGIYQSAGTYQGRIGTNTFGSGTATALTWTHLAIVRNNGTAIFYVNGSATGTNATTPISPTGLFGVAINPAHLTQDQFLGNIDEVRIFTFTANQFSSADLLINAGLPSATNSAASNIFATGATLNGTANPGGLPVTYYFQYGTSTGYGSTSSTGTLPAGTTATAVAKALTGLSGNTLYHYRLIASNSVGTNASSDLTFTTPAVSTPTPATFSATSISTNGATLNGMLGTGGATTTYYFQYGRTTGYGSSTPTNSLVATIMPYSVSNLVTVAAPRGTPFHYRLVAANSAGTAFGGDLTFTVVPTNPTFTLQPATAITGTGGTLNSLVGPNGYATTVYFKYGLTPSYGNSTPTQAVRNTALNFNGVNQAAFSSNNLTGLAAGNTPHTIEAWLNPTLAPATREWVILLGNAGNGAHCWLLNSDGSTQFGVFGGNQVNPQLTANIWTHIAATFDGTTYRVYTNGVLFGSTNATFNLAGIPLTLAQTVNESDYSGDMDEVRIWNTARSASEIMANYTSTLTGNETGLVAYYQMDEASGTTLRDASGQGNVAFTVNSPIATNCAALVTAMTRCSQTLSGLTPGTTYHFQIVASNAAESLSGADQTFTTVPVVITQPPANVTMNGLVNPNGMNTSAWFEWGLGSIYGQQTAPASVGDGSADLTFSSSLAVTPGWAYHYRAVASNALGFVRGLDARLWTPGLSLVGPSLLTNLLNAPFTDPGTALAASPQLVAGGYYHSLALRSDATITPWGNNDDGQTNIPVSATNVIALAAGESFSVALRADGTPVAWGNNDFGQLNIPTNAANLVAIAVGNSYSIAARANGTVAAWGTSSINQVNIATNAAYLTNVVSLAAGLSHCLAVRANGSVVAWGDNSKGQTNIPANVTNVMAVAVGDFHSVALQADGTVRAWGGNSSGQTNVPASVTNVLAIAANSSFSLALRADGTVIAWGSGASGQTNVPASVSNAVAISAGQHHGLALRSDGAVIAWGDNTYGQAGVPNGLTNLNLPVFVNGAVVTNAPGNYVLTYSVTNALGGFTTVSRTVVVPHPVAGSIPVLTGMTSLPDGTFQFGFTNTPSASFTVYAHTNVGAPLANWAVFTNVIESPPGQFHFTIPQQRNIYTNRFFRVQSP